LVCKQHEFAIKDLVNQSHRGFVFKRVPPQPYSELHIVIGFEWLLVEKCVFCGLGFALVWATKMLSCKHMYHGWCSTYHFSKSTKCILEDCAAKMHHAWWDCVGLSKLGTIDGLNVQKIKFEKRGGWQPHKLVKGHSNFYSCY
jgi:hypothetical protein